MSYRLSPASHTLTIINHHNELPPARQFDGVCSCEEWAVNGFRTRDRVRELHGEHLAAVLGPQLDEGEPFRRTA